MSSGGPGSVGSPGGSGSRPSVASLNGGGSNGSPYLTSGGGNSAGNTTASGNGPPQASNPNSDGPPGGIVVPRVSTTPRAYFFLKATWPFWSLTLPRFLLQYLWYEEENESESEWMKVTAVECVFTSLNILKVALPVVFWGLRSGRAGRERRFVKCGRVEVSSADYCPTYVFSNSDVYVSLWSNFISCIWFGWLSSGSTFRGHLFFLHRLLP